MEAPPTPPPPPPPQDLPNIPKSRRPIWRILLLGSFAVGAAYVYTTTLKNNQTVQVSQTEKEIQASSSNNTTAATPSVVEEPLVPPPLVETVKREPIPESQQRELFKWMLEEKRKIKPKSPQEKKQIDEEKAILKQFIRAKTIPSL
ncbi:hypothetical protein ACFE04_018210 [Oxalis oulophora]